jgi:tRNA(Leu) C34 or U34 (ribose-2'-O)-methylase TrmL
MANRGYYGIAVFQPKTEENFGGILRSAHAFGASFIALIGARYRKQATDTSHAARHLPIFHYPDMETFIANRPHDCEIVRCEVDGRTPLPEFTHKPRSIYLFGGEDRTIPQDVGERGVHIDTAYCLNLASTASIVMYDRAAKGVRE